MLVSAVLVRQFLVVGENRRLLLALADQALRDPLTGLANRALFHDRLTHAVQLQHRYERISPPRRMNGADWAAWEAVKAVTQAVMRTRSTDFDAVKAFLLSDKLTLDTVKGNPGSFRAWDHQLRAPVLLSTADAVIGRAPLPQYLHQTNVLDTLGIDAPETTCRF